jgi:hypothetical protein
MLESTRAARTKILLAIAGGGAVLGMAGLAVVADQGTTPDASVVAAPVIPGPMTVGDTVTVTAPVTVLPTEKAVVTHKAVPYRG